MSKTPQKSDNGTWTQAIKQLKTPSKDLQGIPRTIYTHVSTLHSMISEMERLRRKGTVICRSIANMKLHELIDPMPPEQVAGLIESLLTALSGYKAAVETITQLERQLIAAAKLHPTANPVINTWPADKIVQQVQKVHQDALRELDLKQSVTENIAHCRDENLTEVYVSAWEFNCYIELDDLNYLFAEMAIVPIT